VFVNHAEKLKWLVKRMLYMKVVSCHANRDAKGLSSPGILWFWQILWCVCCVWSLCDVLLQWWTLQLQGTVMVLLPWQQLLFIMHLVAQENYDIFSGRITFAGNVGNDSTLYLTA